MGTRGTITVIFNGRKFTLYNHCDSYPSGLGEQLLEELRAALEKMVIIKYEKSDDADGKSSFKLRAPTEEEIKALEPYTDLTVSRKSTSDWYCLLRGCQGSLTTTIQAGYVLDHGDDKEEYNYVIDADEQRYYCREVGKFSFTFQ